MGKRFSILLFLVVTFLTVFAFTAGSGSAQTTGSATAGAAATRTSGSSSASPSASTAATVAPSATTAATVAPSATKAATTTGTGATSGGAVATGTGGATVTTLPATGQPHNGAMNAVIIELLVLALAIIGTGVALKRRASRT